MYYHKKVHSPVGELKLVATDQSLIAILWENDDPARTFQKESTEQENHLLLVEAEKQLAEYFKTQRMVFELPLEFTGTEFQKKVWKALLTIPFGETRTYGQIAQQIGDPNAVRAVGGAANKNPISIIAPCHRVIGASGKLTGFAGGLKTKSYLLQLEYTKRNPTLW